MAESQSQGWIWIPPPFTAIYKLTVTRKDGTIDDITDLINYVDIEDGVTDSIGRFEFELWDPNETYVNAWTGNEIVKYYSDYSDTAVTLRFRGRAEKVIAKGNKIKVSGRSESLKIMNVTVTKQYSNIECTVILKDLFDTYATDFTYVNAATSGVTITVDWSNKPFFECVQELTKATGFDFYIDANLDAHFFLSGSVINETEAIIHDQNLLEVGEFGKDYSLIRNRIIVYGAEQDGVQVLYTSEDADSQNAYGVKEEIINDDNITSYTHAKEYGVNLLADLKDPPDVGEVKGVLLATIQPGEKIRVSSPADGIHPADYDIISYKHKVDNTNGEMSTIVYMSKEPRNVTHVLKSMINTENNLKSTSTNPKGMKYSYIERFDSNTGTHSNTVISGGYLQVSSGDSGIWVSDTQNIDINATEAYLLIFGEVLESVVVSVSADAGITYDEITRKENIVLSASGNKLKVKIEFSSASSKVDSISVMYR